MFEDLKLYNSYIMADTRKYNQKRNETRKKSYKNICLPLNREADGYIIDWLEQQPNKTKYLRDLIINDMEKHKGK